MCLARHNNHPTSLASSWDISFLRSLVQQDPKGSDKVAHLFILDVYVSPNRKYVNLSIIYYILDFSFFMSQDDAYFHIHQNDPYTSFNYLRTSKLRVFTQDLSNLRQNYNALCFKNSVSHKFCNQNLSGDGEWIYFYDISDFTKFDLDINKLSTNMLWCLLLILEVLLKSNQC